MTRPSIQFGTKAIIFKDRESAIRLLTEIKKGKHDGWQIYAGYMDGRIPIELFKAVKSVRVIKLYDIIADQRESISLSVNEMCDCILKRANASSILSFQMAFANINRIQRYLTALESSCRAYAHLKYSLNCEKVDFYSSVLPLPSGFDFRKDDCVSQDFPGIIMYLMCDNKESYHVLFAKALISKKFCFLCHVITLRSLKSRLRAKILHFLRMIRRACSEKLFFTGKSPTKAKPTWWLAYWAREEGRVVDLSSLLRRAGEDNHQFTSFYRGREKIQLRARLFWEMKIKISQYQQRVSIRKIVQDSVSARLRDAGVSSRGVSEATKWLSCVFTSNLGLLLRIQEMVKSALHRDIRYAGAITSDVDIPEPRMFALVCRAHGIKTITYPHAFFLTHFSKYYFHSDVALIWGNFEEDLIQTKPPSKKWKIGTPTSSIYAKNDRKLGVRASSCRLDASVTQFTIGLCMSDSASWYSYHKNECSPVLASIILELRDRGYDGRIILKGHPFGDREYWQDFTASFKDPGLTYVNARWQPAMLYQCLDAILFLGNPGSTLLNLILTSTEEYAMPARVINVPSSNIDLLEDTGLTMNNSKDSVNWLIDCIRDYDCQVKCTRTAFENFRTEYFKESADAETRIVQMLNGIADSGFNYPAKRAFAYPESQMEGNI